MNIHTAPKVQPLTYSEDIENIRLDAFCLAPEYGLDWTLKNLYTAEDALSQNELVDHIGRRLQYLEIPVEGDIFAPSVAAMSGALVAQEELDIPIPLSGGYVLRRKKELPGDAVRLHADRKQKFMMSGAGCPIIVLIGGGLIIAAHGSRDSLVDRERVETGEPSRMYESVIDAAYAEFERLYITPEEIEVRIFFTVPRKMFGHSFSHPVYGAANRRLFEDIRRRRLGIEVMTEEGGFLSIPALVVGLCRKIGIVHVQSKCSLPAEGWFAHTRHPSDLLANSRNLEGVCVSYVP